MTQQQNLLTSDVKALIGQASDVTEMYGVVDQESVRRFIVGIPDQDPRHWDAELASPRFGGTTTPAAMVSYIGNRQPPWQADHFHELMLENPLRYLSPPGGRRTPAQAAALLGITIIRHHRAEAIDPRPPSGLAKEVIPGVSQRRVDLRGNLNRRHRSRF